MVLTVDRLDRVGEARLLARRTRHVALQSVAVGMGLSMAAMGVAAAGLLPVVWGALLQEAIDVAVILNALRALRGPGTQVRLSEADNELARRFQTEHLEIRADLEQLRLAADSLAEFPPPRLSVGSGRCTDCSSRKSNPTSKPKSVNCTSHSTECSAAATPPGR